MPGKPIGIGPFVGGLNNISEAGAAEDDEVVDLVNFEVTLDKALTSRPPMQTVGGSVLPSTNTLGWDILGIYRITAAEWYLVVTAPTTTTNNVNTTVKAYLHGIIGDGETVLIIKGSAGLNNRVESMVQFKDELFFCQKDGSTDSGFKWKKGDASATDITAMPKGSVMISWKTRIWISGSGAAGNGDRVYFSTINSSGPQPGTWGAQDFFDVAPGEGGFITAMITSFSNLLIFKSDGTWRFSFPSGPEDGIVDKISGQVGAANRHSVVEFENYIYVYDQGAIYELINSNYTQINKFVDFKENPFSVDSVAPDVELSLVNRRLMFRYLNSIYAYTVDTKAWSQWFSYSGTPGKFYELPIDSVQSSAGTYLAPSKGTEQSVTLNLVVDPLFGDKELTEIRKNVSGGDTYFNNDIVNLVSRGSITRLYLNATNSASDYNIPVSEGQKFVLSFEVISLSGVDTRGIAINYTKFDGTFIQEELSITTVGLKSQVFTVPAGAILARLSIFASDGNIELKSPNYNRNNSSSPQSLIRISDEYPNQIETVEYIESWVTTKSYDYQAAPAFKRLFYWGIDVKTPRRINAEARPVGRDNPITWGDLENYTWTQLEQGTWENPLSWLNVSNVVLDTTDPSLNISTNGRYFVKILKSLRFRQIAFYIKMTTLGNRDTGPTKLFSMTTMVTPKQDVVDKTT